MKVQWIPQICHNLNLQYLEKWFAWCEQQLRERKIIRKNFEPTEVVVVLVNSAEAQRLNQDFRFQGYIPDVLSFESDDPETLGEMALCLEVIEGKAEAESMSMDDYVAYLLLHGLLHLLGYEHEEGGRKAEEMFAIQDELYERIKDFQN